MSYASVASHNIAPGDHGAKPDQLLTEGHFPGETPVTTGAEGKLNIVPAGEDPHHAQFATEPSPAPEPIILHPPESDDPSTSNVAPPPLPTPSKGQIHMPESTDKFEKVARENVNKAEKKGKELGDKAKANLDEAESQLAPYWEKTKEVLLRPGSLGGLMGVVNVGLLATLGYFAYTRKDQPWDRRIVSGAVAGTVALFGAEGYVTDSYLQTPEGRQEAERAKIHGSKLYLEAKERILRPEVAGGLVGAFNLAVLGTVGYFSYTYWHEPWDRRVVSAVAVGLIGLSGLEGWAGKEYKDKELPRR